MAELTDDIQKYEDAWVDTMIQIWKEKIERLRVIRTGALHESFSDQINRTKSGDTLKLKFLRYGIYQALGTGYGYDSAEKGNNGDLKFLDPAYRERHRLNMQRKVGPAWGGYMTSGKPRKRRDWFSRKLFMSVIALREDLARITGEQAAMIICNALHDTRNVVRR